MAPSLLERAELLRSGRLSGGTDTEMRLSPVPAGQMDSFRGALEPEPEPAMLNRDTTGPARSLDAEGSVHLSARQQEAIWHAGADLARASVAEVRSMFSIAELRTVLHVSSPHLLSQLLSDEGLPGPAAASGYTQKLASTAGSATGAGNAIDKRQALFAAVMREDTAAIQHLLVADPALLTSKNKAGLTPTELAIERGKAEALSCLQGDTLTCTYGDRSSSSSSSHQSGSIGEGQRERDTKRGSLIAWKSPRSQVDGLAQTTFQLSTRQSFRDPLPWSAWLDPKPPQPQPPPPPTYSYSARAKHEHQHSADDDESVEVCCCGSYLGS